MIDSFNKKDSIALKGCVIILMIMHHLFRAPSLYQGFDINFLCFSEKFINDLFTYFKLCVGTFAFVSGYGLSLAYKKSIERENYSSFVTKRIYKTLLPFWFIYVIVFCVGLFVNGTVNKTYFSGTSTSNGILRLLLDAFCLQSFTKTPSLDTSWWYMGAAIMFIAVVPLIVKALKKCDWFVLLLFVVILPRALGVKFPGGTSVLSFLMPVVLGVIFQTYGLFGYINSFKVKFFNVKFIEEAITFLLFAGGAVFGYLVYTYTDKSILWELSYGFVPLTFIIFVSRYVVKIPYLRNVLCFFGNHSMNIFLTHTVIREYFMNFLYGRSNFLVTILLLVAMSVVSSIAIEGLKILVRFKRLEKRQLLQKN